MKVNDKDFEPHLMFEPKTRKSMLAETMEEHLIFKELGLVHEDELEDKEGEEGEEGEEGKVAIISFMDAVEKGVAE